MSKTTLDLIEDAYKQAVTERGVNNPLTRELGSIYIRHKGRNANSVLTEIRRAVNLQSRGGLSTTPPIQDNEGKKPQPQEVPPPLPPKSPAPQSPAPSSAAAVVPEIDLSELKSLSVNTISDRYSHAALVAAAQKFLKPGNKPFSEYSARQLAKLLQKG